MVKVGKSQKAPARTPTYQVGVMLLLETNASLVDAEEEKDSARLFANVEIRPLIEQANGYFFTCDMSAGRKASENELPVSVSARYGCIISTESRDRSQAQKWAYEIASTMMWSRFSDLFAGITNQMRQRLPVFPVVPDNVDFVDE